MMKFRPEFLVGGLAAFVLAVTIYLFIQMDSVKRGLDRTEQFNKQNREDLIKLNNLMQLQLRETFGDEDEDEDEDEDDDDEEADEEDDDVSESEDEESEDSQEEETRKPRTNRRKLTNKKASEEDKVKDSADNENNVLNEGPVIEKSKSRGKTKRRATFWLAAAAVTPSSPGIIALKDTPKPKQAAKIQEIVSDSDESTEYDDDEEDEEDDEDDEQEQQQPADAEPQADTNTAARRDEAAPDTGNEDTELRDDETDTEVAVGAETTSETTTTTCDGSCPVEVRVGRKQQGACGKPLMHNSDYCKAHSKKSLKLQN